MFTLTTQNHMPNQDCPDSLRGSCRFENCTQHSSPLAMETLQPLTTGWFSPVMSVAPFPEHQLTYFLTTLCSMVNSFIYLSTLYHRRSYSLGWICSMTRVSVDGFPLCLLSHTPLAPSSKPGWKLHSYSPLGTSQAGSHLGCFCMLP